MFNEEAELCSQERLGEVHQTTQEIQTAANQSLSRITDVQFGVQAVQDGVFAMDHQLTSLQDGNSQLLGHSLDSSFL